jgi:hypothetical protein
MPVLGTARSETMTAKPDPKKILDEDFAVSQEWQEEIRHRCVEIDSGKVRFFDNTLVIDALRTKYIR